MINNDDILVSICVPTYNRPDYLKKSITVIKKAINFNWLSRIELIICDNSQDLKSKKICEDILKEWTGSYTYKKNHQNLGMIGNWNECIDQSNGQYIYILHDDDFLHVKNFNSILDILNKNRDYNVFKFGVCLVDDDENKIKNETNNKNIILEKNIAVLNLLRSSTYVRFPSMIVSKSAYLQVGYFDNDFGYIADYDMWYRLFSNNKVFVSNLVIAYYRRTFSSYSGQMFSQKSINLIRKLFSKVKPNELIHYQDNFIAQFFIAGIIRNLIQMRFSESKKLFILTKKNKLKPFIKYRFIFKILNILMMFIKNK